MATKHIHDNTGLLFTFRLYQAEGERVPVVV